MSGDLIVRDTIHYNTLGNLIGDGAVVGVVGNAVGFAGKAASIFSRKGSFSKNLFSTVSSLSIFAGILGFATLGAAYFLKDSVTNGDINKQKAKVLLEEGILKTRGGNEITYFVEQEKLNWLQKKKDIQQAVYSLIGWKG